MARDFLELLASRCVLADGPIGPRLHALGVGPEVCLEELCATAPERVAAIHGEYLAAGAEVVRTHSLEANALRLARHGQERRVGELNWLAAQIAREAARAAGAWVAARVGPAGPGWSGAVFAEQIGALLDGGADFVLLEGFTDLDELRAALEAKHSLHHCPVVACLAWSEPEAVAHGAAAALAAGADVVGVIGAGDPVAVGDALAGLAGPLAAFPDPGRGPGAEAACFAAAAAGLPGRGVRLLGGCGVTGPEHVAALAARLRP